MKKLSLHFSLLFVLAALFTSCNNDDDEIQIIDPTRPQGTFVVDRSGTFTAQNSTPTAGTAELGQDADNTTFLRFASDFTTELGTGTVTVYLSTSMDFVPDPGNGNPNLKLIGAVAQNGENFYRIEGGVQDKYTHVILWCGSANIPFGFAPLN